MGRPGQPRVAEKRLPQEGVVIHCPYRPPKLTGVISDDMCRQNHMMPGHSKRRTLQLQPAK
jgi:hypothetical protein